MRSLRSLGRVVDGPAGAEHAGVDAEERERPDEGVGHDLEGQRRERRAVLGLALRPPASCRDRRP